MNCDSRLRTAEAEVALAAKSIEVARAEAVAIEARVAAELAKHALVDAASVRRPDAGSIGHVAAKAERRKPLVKAELDALRAEQQLDLAKSGSKKDDVKAQEAVKSVEAKLTAARAAAQAAVEAAKSNAAKEDVNYTPLGPMYPTTSSGRRLALAKWLTDKGNPLTARVAVNHVWKRHFGTALVPSVANFGLNGKPATHPALLDWLAVEFMDSGWSLKHLHRLIVTSAAYRRVG